MPNDYSCSVVDSCVNCYMISLAATMIIVPARIKSHAPPRPSHRCNAGSDLLYCPAHCCIFIDQLGWATVAKPRGGPRGHSSPGLPAIAVRFRVFHCAVIPSVVMAVL
jgi:hypothetical protein